MTTETKKGAPQCGLYLILPENWMEPDFLTQLKGMFRAINASPYEKNAHIVELRLPAAPQTKDHIEIIAAMAALTKSQGVVFVISDDFDLAKAVDADGVLLNNIETLARARAVMGDDAIIGLRCGTSRRIAAKALEGDADYVSFYDMATGHIDPAIIKWWKIKTDTPCLVEGNITANDCGFYVDAGADFVDVSTYVFTHKDGIMQAIVNMTDALDGAIIGNKRKYN